VHFDDFGYAGLGLNKNNREAVGEYITGYFENLKQFNASEAWLNDMDDIYHAHFYVYKTFDMVQDDPVYRQLLLDIDGDLDKQAVIFNIT